MERRIFFLWVILSIFSIKSAAVSINNSSSFNVENGNFIYKGKIIHLYSGEIHYARIPAPYWRHRLQMIKAMGLNAVSCYVFWNYHEIKPGQWDWKTKNRNLRLFIKIAQEEGLMVILRPGPYCCAEWEFGGYPWWLQKDKTLILRTYNKSFLDSCKTYIKELATQVKDLQITHGGPIIMVQVENEFGSYVAQRSDISMETHKKYSATIKQYLLNAGFDVPMYTSDGLSLLKGGVIDGTLPTVNGELNANKLKEAVNHYHNGKGPYMVAEYYPGWLDHWGEPFVKTPTDSVVKQINRYLKEGISFNFYMAHGGSNFGFFAGANYSTKYNIKPDITSYDYDAPISEAGTITPKYMAIRDLMIKNVSYKVPAIPRPIPVVGIRHIKFTASFGLYDLIAQQKPVICNTPQTFESLNQGFGYVLYRKHFIKSMKGELQIKGIADYATIYVDEKKIGELNKIYEKDSIGIDIPANGTLDILVENVGRINYNARIIESSKGITTPVTINGDKIEGKWQMFRLPFNSVPRLHSSLSTYKAGIPTLYGASFFLKNIGDTFLDMRKWGKGIVFVNGNNLGRYWKIGPQQTLYLPGCFLRKGKNSIVIFEQQNDEKYESISSIKIPILNQLQLEKK